MNLSAQDEALWAAGLVGNAVLFAALILRQRWRGFPVFSVLIGFYVARTVLLFAMYRYSSALWYARVYWFAASMDFGLQLGVVCEVARIVMRPTGTWVQDARKLFFLWGGAGVLLAAALPWLVSPPASNLLGVMEVRGNLFTSVLICELIGQAKSFEEDLLVVDAFDSPVIATPQDDDTEAAYRALVIGTRDYVRKCGFCKVLVALSGGIDSALVAAIATDALGPENVLGIGMPSPYSSSGSIDDSRRLAQNLGIRFEVIGINGLFDEYREALAPLFEGTRTDTTEENIQSRIRGVLMMALSNKFSALVLTTGNKSEMAVGYCTLYGDMVGALAVIGDLVKTRVYAVCRWLNRDRETIPPAVIEKPPSAELRPDQKDTDSLPPYEVLDPILEAYVERYETPEAIAHATGTPLSLVQQVVRLVERSEYKRQQAAPVLKVTSKSFGMGRRFPIAVTVEV